MRIRLMMLAVLFSVLLGFSFSAWAGSALDLVQQKERVVRKILQRPTKEGTAAHEKKREDLRKEINTFFDFGELGKRSLGVHWNDCTDTEKSQFLDKLQKLIEKSYLEKIVGQPDYKAKFFGDQVLDNEAVVRLKIKSGKHIAKLEFKLMEKENLWVVFDMIIDDVSLLENYRTQFGKIIRKKGFGRVLEKMDKKLSDKDDKKTDTARNPK